MAEALLVLVHFGVITQEQADEYWQEWQHELEAIRIERRDFEDQWMADWRARASRWDRFMVWLTVSLEPGREMREAWYAHAEQRALDT